MNVPALCGSSIVADLLYNEGISFDEHTLMQMVQAGFVMENDFDWLFDLIPLDMLDEPARALIWRGFGRFCVLWQRVGSAPQKRTTVCCATAISIQ